MDNDSAKGFYKNRESEARPYSPGETTAQQEEGINPDIIGSAYPSYRDIGEAAIANGSNPVLGEIAETEPQNYDGRNIASEQNPEVPPRENPTFQETASLTKVAKAAIDNLASNNNTAEAYYDARREALDILSKTYGPQANWQDGSAVQEGSK